jgi:hypothetical protein
MVNGDEQNAKTKNGKRLNRQALQPGLPAFGGLLDQPPVSPAEAG